MVFNSNYQLDKNEYISHELVHKLSEFIEKCFNKTEAKPNINWHFEVLIESSRSSLSIFHHFSLICLHAMAQVLQAHISYCRKGEVRNGLFRFSVRNLLVFDLTLAADVTVCLNTMFIECGHSIF